MSIARAIAWLGILGGVFSLLAAAIYETTPMGFAIVGGIAALAFLVTWVTASIHAFLTGRFWWSVACLLAWPVAFVYVLKVPPMGPTPG